MTFLHQGTKASCIHSNAFRTLNTKNSIFMFMGTHAARWAYLFVFLYELGCFHPAAHIEADVHLDLSQGVSQFDDGDLGGRERWKIREQVHHIHSQIK